MKMPATVRVGGLDYTIKPWNRMAADNTGAYGMCDRSTLVILIQEGLTPQWEAHVLVHEVLHAAYAAAGMTAIHEHVSEERLVGALSYQLIQVWRDNPDLVAYIEAVFRPAKGKLKA
ncbi:hypothetical protein [Aminobacter sp. HY435]|uniref:hypothetical protein n=1 Tax=Aminobacter sp. HY435 TaxID=2970917 RepID=UPI0022B9B93F|nr:hypothetical protein [Aminobacter sp. HY435]